MDSLERGPGQAGACGPLPGRMLQVTINGETHSFAAGTTIEQMLEALRLPGEGVAVEVNRSIVPKRMHQEALLSDGDEVEVVTFVGGG